MWSPTEITTAKALIVVHPPSGSGGRRVTARGEILGPAHCDYDLVVFLEGAGLPDADDPLEHPAQ